MNRTIRRETQMKSIKKVLISLFAVCLIVCSLTGCWRKEVTVATINGKTISKQLYYISLWTTQRGLETVQEHFWSLDNIEGKSPEEFAKTKSLQMLARFTVVEQKAEELGIKLTKEEKAKVKEAAKTAMAEQKAFAKAYDIKQKDYEKYYRFAVLNDKVLEALEKSYEPNASEISNQIITMQNDESEENQATVVHILFKTQNELGETIPEDKKQDVYRKAEEVLKKALSGEDIYALAATYSEDISENNPVGEETFIKTDDVDSNFAKAVFEEAKVGEVYPKIVETAMGYEIIKVLEIKEESEEAFKERAITSIKAAYASRELKEMTAVAEIEKTEAYDEIHVLPSNMGESTVSE